jgi:diaminohydroxyphosphoribosylaminopyrimidine deaminase/5-amino-6-(5-phosphoribosylamino)uracil reductase
MSKPDLEVDVDCMRRALRLARLGIGFVEPNPTVGCVIAKRNRIIGEGYHRRFGGMHAEVEALSHCSEPAAGATVYVSLEPCNFAGKTPACTEALIKARVRRVVAAMLDPNPRVSGKGLAALRDASIEVTHGLLEPQARRINAPFVKFITQRRPWVILKWAQSLDGKIATHTGDSKWISDEQMLRHAHLTRGRVDAILVGASTVQRDDPMLTARRAPAIRVATRVVLDSTLRIPLESALVRTAREVPTIIYCAPEAPDAARHALAEAGCRVHPIPRRQKRFDLGAVLDELGRAGSTNLLIEGGAETHAEFLRQNLADELHIYVAPRIIGGSAAPSPIGGDGAEKLADAIQLTAPLRPRRLGGGLFIQSILRTSELPRGT